jgi:hypothetical protein
MTLRNRWYPRRRASLTSEAIVSLSALVLVTIAVLVFGMLVTVQNAVTYASIRGAREAAKGADLTAVVGVVNEQLAHYQITIDATSANSTMNAAVILEDPALGTPQKQGHLACDPPSHPSFSDLAAKGNVRVTVGVAATAVPLANQLEKLGLSFLHDLLKKSAVAKSE